QRQELLRGEHSLRDLAADHHRAVLPLAIDPVDQAEGAPRVGRKLSALELLQLGDESIQLALVRESQARRTKRLRMVHLGHGRSSFTPCERCGAPAAPPRSPRPARPPRRSPPPRPTPVPPRAPGTR